MKEWLRYQWNKLSPVGREYNLFIDQLKIEQDFNRKNRVYNWWFENYPLQKGMLPKNWQKLPIKNKKKRKK